MTQPVPKRSLSFAFLAIFIALAFPLLIEITFSDHVREGEYNSRLGWALILMFIGLMIRNARVIKVLLIPFIIGGSIDIGYAVSFGGVFTTATLEAVFNTDSNEALEYISSYASLPLTLILSFYWLSLIFVLRDLQFNFPQSKARTSFLVIGALLTLTAGYRITVMEKYHDTIPGVLGSMPSYYKGSMGLQQEIALRKSLIENTLADAKISQPELAQTYIFVIGESMNRNHMSVYGYHRNTTPFLSQLDENSVIFENVISSHAQTNASLRVALTSASATEKQSKHFREALSIIDAANLAGFKTWWISNQQPMRATIASIASQSDRTQFISNDYQGVEVNRYDGFMLPYIEEALADEAKHKVIFIHMMGSHAQYSNRYPRRFEYFIDNNVKGYQDDLSQGKVDSINEYDNSILYTDSVLHDTWKLLTQDTAEIKAFTLFSDHGEEIYDQINIKGHSPDNVTANMLEVPLITWTSSGYAKHKEKVLTAMKNNQKQAFRLDNLYHFATDLIGIQSTLINRQKSLASTEFEAMQERKVYNQSYEQTLRYRTQAIKPAVISKN